MRTLPSFVFCLILFGCLATAKPIFGQAESVKIAVFAPIYTDSAFTGSEYKLGLNNLPKQMLAGLDFYNGVMMAADSLKAEGRDVDILFYDLKGSESIYTIIRKPEFDKVNMIIAAFNNKQDVKPLAEIAQHRNIPIISETYPNDGGITNNPYFVMINPSLKIHVEELYKYVQRNYSTTNIVYVKKKGQLEDAIQYYYANMAKTTPGIPLKMKVVELTDSFTENTLLKHLDTTLKNTIICGSIQENFGIRVVKALSANQKYESVVMGMPTWDGLKELESDDCDGVTTVFTTPYNFSRSSPLGFRLYKLYKGKFFAKPGDMFYKGYESLYHFGNLLIQNPTNIMSHLSDKSFKLFNDFDIHPLIKADKTTQYLENKKLYFIKKNGGENK